MLRGCVCASRSRTQLATWQSERTGGEEASEIEGNWSLLRGWRRGEVEAGAKGKIGSSPLCGCVCA
eukprot:100192-Chlamydomonas_euryale.AAC.1